MIQGLRQKFTRFCGDTSGATAIEYGLLAALIGIGLIAGLKAFGSSTNGTWGNMQGDVSNGLS